MQTPSCQIALESDAVDSIQVSHDVVILADDDLAQSDAKVFVIDVDAESAIGKIICSTCS